tara:strand:- start:78 stop:437 length:360 start_codon:yes stop_codon:yes gene_type:complete
MNDPQQISEEAVFNWYSYLDKVFSILYFTAAITALQFEEHSAEIATISLIFLVMLAFSMARDREIKKHTQRMQRYKGKTYMLFIGFFKSPIFVISLSMLVCVACDVLTLDFIEGFKLIP